MDNEYLDLERNFKSLSVAAQRVLTSKETAQAVRKIGDKNGLKLDQIDVLFDKTADVILGTLSSAEFFSTLAKEAEIDEKIALTIGKEIDSQVFKKVKSEMRKDDDFPITEASSNRNRNSSLERAGDFEIEPTLPHYGVEQSSLKNSGAGVNPFTGNMRDVIMSELENPTPTKVSAKNPMIEPLVDQLLRGAGAHLEQRLEMKTPQPPQPPQPPRNLPTNDPYREPMK